MNETPSDDAYGRVTNPERYRVLHEVAATVLDNLVTRYDVERIVARDELLAREGQRVERLVPAGGGAAVSVAFTSFPGLEVRFGEWCVKAFPVCGCDACEEQPQSLADEFVSNVEAVVAGQFYEHLRGLPRLSLTYEFRRGTQRRWSRLTPADVNRLGGPGLRRWQPWSPLASRH